MDLKNFQEEIAQLIQARDVPENVNWFNLPIDKETLIDELTHPDTVSELMPELKLSIPSLAPLLGDTLIPLLDKHFKPEHLESVGIHLNPIGRFDAKGKDIEIVLSNDTSTLFVNAGDARVIVSSPKEQPVQIVGGHVDCHGETRATYMGGSIGAAYGRCHVKAKDSSEVYLNRHAMGIAEGFSRVYARGQSTVIQRDYAKVDADKAAILIDETEERGKYSFKIGDEIYVPRTGFERRALLDIINARANLVEETIPLPGHTMYDPEHFEKVKGHFVEMAERVATHQVEALKASWDYPELLHNMEGLRGDKERMIIALTPAYLKRNIPSIELMAADIYTSSRELFKRKTPEEFYLLGSDLVFQPEGVRGHYFEHSIGIVERGAASFCHRSLGITKGADVRAAGHSFLFAQDSHVALDEYAIGRVEGNSKANADGHSRLYGGGTSHLTSGSKDSVIIQFDDARVNAINATVYADMDHVDLAYDGLLVSDENELSNARRSGLTREDQDIREQKKR